MDDRMPRKIASILIIENDPPTLELYRREFSRDYQVLACPDEEDALQMANTSNLCAVVLEPAVSAGKGWLILPALLEALRGRRVPVILCSTQDDRKRGLQAGATAFLVKPVLPAELRETLQKVIA
jgi:DNA-binding response OmpR family regulator